MPIEVFIFIGLLGIALGVGVVLISQKDVLPKRKYGYKKPSKFDYYSKIDQDVLNCNQPTKLEDYNN